MLDLSDLEIERVVTALRLLAKDRDDAANRMISETRYHQEMAASKAASELADKIWNA